MYDDRPTADAAAEYSIFEISDSKALHEMSEATEPQKWLFGEFWAEGEMAMLFGDHGTGKSILAAQIADGIARGSTDEPFEVSSKGRSVVFLDLEQTAAEFAARYGGEHKAYKFTRNFQHIAVDPFAEVPKKYGSFLEYLCESVEDIVRRKRPKALIVDSLAHLKRSNDITRDVLPLVRVLSRLKRELGLSILLVAPSQRRLGSKTMEIGDMQGSRGLVGFADSVFAIATSGTDTTRRYLKQLKVRRREMLYDRTHTVGVNIRKDITGDLKLVFDKFADESVHYRDSPTVRNWDLVEKVKQMHDEGKPFSFIALMLGISKTSAYRLFQMWVPIPLDCPHHPDNKARAQSEPPAVAGGLNPISTNDGEPVAANEIWHDDDDEDLDLLNEESRILVEMERAEAEHSLDVESGFQPEYRPFIGPPDLGAEDGFPATTPAIRKGQKVWIEKYDERGEPISWIKMRKDGTPSRGLIDGLGVRYENVEQNTQKPRSGDGN